MKRFLFLVCTLAGCLSLAAQSSNPKYDSVLAKSLGGDDYGMKMYVLVILKTGTASFDKKKTDSLFQGHMANIGRLANEGKLIVAGPLKKMTRPTAAYLSLMPKQ